jgi:hypothetical protein
MLDSFRESLLDDSIVDLRLPIADCKPEKIGNWQSTIGNDITFQTSQWVGPIGPPKHFLLACKGRARDGPSLVRSLTVYNRQRETLH